MRLISDVTQFREVLPRLVLTIGSFDGVHLGHQRILREVVSEARKRNGTAAAMALQPHPREYFSPQNAPNILTDDEKKAELMEEIGLDVFFYLPFNSHIANMERQVFVEKILLECCHADMILVGHDFAFGKGAEGNFAYLDSISSQYGFDVIEVPPLILHGERVSSTLIREAVLQGELDKAEVYLGRRYAISGTVQSGRGMGKKLGFPTANIEPHNKTIPAHGVYVAEALYAGQTYAAAVNIGIAPTIRHDDIMIEAHILDFDKNIVNERIEIVFHKRLRPEAKYDSYDALISAIHKDVQAVRVYFTDL